MDDATLQFARPLWLAAGLPLAALVLAAFLRADRRRRADLAKLAHPRFLERLLAGWSPTLRWIRRSLWLAAILALSIAAAGPRYGFEWREVKRRGIDILFALDTSRSMLAEDIKPNRLDRARLGILDFLDQLQGDRVGLVPFAGTAFALCPLTLDYDAFRESLNSVNTDMIPRPGTDIASAIREADRLFDKEGNNHRFLVLITDGEDLEGDAVSAAEEAAKTGTTIYTVGVGDPNGQTIPIRDRFGRQDLVRDASGNVVTTKLDSTTLQKIAEATGGIYVPLGAGAEGLQTIYQERLSIAPKTEMEQKLEKKPLERFQWPLGLALLMLMLQAIMGERKPQRKSTALASAARRHLPPTVATVILLSAWAVQAAVQPQVEGYNSGTSAYSQGEFEQAAEKLRSSLDNADLELQQKAYYNLGCSLYRNGQTHAAEDPEQTLKTWKESLKAFEDSLALNAKDADAQYNRDFVKRKIEELEQQQNQDQKSQDQQSQDQESKDQDQKDQQNQDSKNQQSQDQKDSQQQNQSGESKDQQQGKDSKDQQSMDQKGSEQEQQNQSGESKDQQQQGKDSKDQQSMDQKGSEQEQQNPSGEQKDQQQGKDSKDQQSMDQKGSEQEQQNPNGEQKDQQQQGKDSKDQQSMDQKGSEQEKSSESKEESKQEAPNEEAKNQLKGQEERQPQANAQPSGSAGEAKENPGADAPAGEVRQVGEMSRDEALRLLETLGTDERVIVPTPLSERNRGNRATNGKTW